jgi:pantetheine-phosphate adenylyltransferase
MTTRRAAVYPGALNPPTLGHLDIIRRGLAVFDEVIVAVAVNPDKHPLWSAEERAALLGAATADLANVTIDTFEGLTVDYAARCGACAILRGIRTMSDFDYESHLAQTNRTMTGIETVFVRAGPQSGYITSSLVREIARLGGDVSKMVPPCVLDALKKKFA